MARTPFVCGNWKLNHSAEQTKSVLTALRRGMADIAGVEVAIAPVTTCLGVAVEAAGRSGNVGIAAQNVHHAEKGAFTGEWSVAHLVEMGVKYAIIGHSERRQFFGETNEGVGKRTRAALDGGITPIACVGEHLEDREAGKTLDVVGAQVAAILDAISEEQVSRLVLAYEPVWAIGTGRTASSDQAQEVHAAIRAQIRKAFGEQADSVRIQYGGSVKPSNAKELLGQPDVDGALVGGASLEADSFLEIVKAAL